VREITILERIASGEADRALRDLALERLQEALVETATGEGPVAESEEALARLTDPRSLSSVASAAVHERVRFAALARVSGDRFLRDVVRNAGDPGIRSAALERIRDVATLRSIALGDGPLDTALQALERSDEP